MEVKFILIDFYLKISPNQQFSNVKNLISKRIGVPANEFFLVSYGKRLKDNGTLRNNPRMNGQNIYAIPNKQAAQQAAAPRANNRRGQTKELFVKTLDGRTITIEGIINKLSELKKQIRGSDPY